MKPIAAPERLLVPAGMEGSRTTPALLDWIARNHRPDRSHARKFRSYGEASGAE